MALFGSSKPKDKTIYFPDRKPITNWWIADDAAKYLKERKENIFAVDNLSNELAQQIEERADFPVYKTAGLVAYAEKNEKKLFDLINQIESEKQEQNTDNVHGTDTFNREFHSFFEENFENDSSKIVPEIIETEEEKLARRAEVLKEFSALDVEKNTEKPKKKSRKSLGRTNRIEFRLTDKEYEKFKKKVLRSKKTQGDYLREMAIHGKVVIEEVTDYSTTIDELDELRANLGRVGGLLKAVIKPNEGNELVYPSQWKMIFSCIKELQEMKETVQELEVKLNGISKTSK